MHHGVTHSTQPTHCWPQQYQNNAETRVGFTRKRTLSQAQVALKICSPSGLRWDLSASSRPFVVETVEWPPEHLNSVSGGFKIPIRICVSLERAVHCGARRLILFFCWRRRGGRAQCIVRSVRTWVFGAIAFVELRPRRRPLERALAVCLSVAFNHATYKKVRRLYVD